ncbi:uncharacterized protein N0V89_003369 [Didymosphaeria variabile]|uniref:TauD/TfdA-like domain-containing protein n=1 Tax=Didymosphaeria variabile TaxID=1932322 RepID=A0A9W8XVZ2_9PLEO|nr:uncharacterized protein N0V89_003369 [Didymosphaeria variabile]KAJ4358785.1 hypothetical protein N0V89_003369 [Didymosphaeria variabile]
MTSELRKSTSLGAEVILPEYMTLLNPKSLSDAEKEVLRKAFFDNGILVIRNQAGIEPQVLYDIADLLDPDHLPYHSGGQKQVTDLKNILSQNNCSRIPRAPQVTVIGSGHVQDYEGIEELDLKHLDQSSFHEHPLSEQEVASGLTRPYRWHMDAALYENLPGIVTSLHAIEVPEVPAQKLQFPDGETMDVAAGATLCEHTSPSKLSYTTDHTSLLRRAKLRGPFPRGAGLRIEHYSPLCAARLRNDPQLQSLIRRPNNREYRPRDPTFRSTALQSRQSPFIPDGVEEPCKWAPTPANCWMLRLRPHDHRPFHRQSNSNFRSRRGAKDMPWIAEESV